MPYGNFDESFEDFTLDYDCTKNDMLALDRGEKPPVNQYDTHPYYVKRLVARTRKADFKYLRPEIQQAYAEKISTHEDFEAQRQVAIQRARQGMIPTGGYLATVDLYVPDATDPNKSKRVRLPSESLQWLIKNMEAQQSGLAPILDMNQGAQAQIADKFSQMQGSNGQSQGGPGVAVA
jgi:hypothetical protein